MSNNPATILVVGATGNTGKNAVRTLSALVAGQDVRVLGLTRSVKGVAAQELAALPQIEIQEKNWNEIDACWLREQNVVKAFVASHNEVDQFVDESNLYVAFLGAGVKYVVRVSTFDPYVSPISPVYYGRTHWAIEQLLLQPEFKDLQWTSLRPNFFSPLFLFAAAGWIASYRATGEQTPLKLCPDADAKVAFIDPDDVGLAGAHLIALSDPTSHDRATYVLNGPEDVTGKDLIGAVEKIIGAKVANPSFNDTDWFGAMFESGIYPKKVIPSLSAGVGYLWGGQAALSAKPTSQAILDLAPPKRTVLETLGAMVGQ